MIRQIIFYVEFIDSLREDTDSGILMFEWNGKSPIMDSAFDVLKNYMAEKYPNEKYEIKDWEWADKR